MPLKLYLSAEKLESADSPRHHKRGGRPGSKDRHSAYKLALGVPSNYQVSVHELDETQITPLGKGHLEQLQPSREVLLRESPGSSRITGSTGSKAPGKVTPPKQAQAYFADDEKSLDEPSDPRDTYAIMTDTPSPEQLRERDRQWTKDYRRIHAETYAIRTDTPPTSESAEGGPPGKGTGPHPEDTSAAPDLSELVMDPAPPRGEGTTGPVGSTASAEFGTPGGWHPRKDPGEHPVDPATKAQRDDSFPPGPEDTLREVTNISRDSTAKLQLLPRVSVLSNFRRRRPPHAPLEDQPPHHQGLEAEWPPRRSGTSLAKPTKRSPSSMAVVPRRPEPRDGLSPIIHQGARGRWASRLRAVVQAGLVMLLVFVAVGTLMSQVWEKELLSCTQQAQVKAAFVYYRRLARCAAEKTHKAAARLFRAQKINQ